MKRPSRLSALVPSVLLAGLLSACGSSDSTDPTAPPPPPSGGFLLAFVGTPTLNQAPNASCPLVATVVAQTNAPAHMRLVLDDGQETSTLEPNPGFSEFHNLLVLGLKTDRTYTIVLEAQDAAGNFVTAPSALSVTTPAFPDPLPPIEITVSNPTLVEPGVTLFVPQWAHAVLDPDPDCVNTIVAVDEQGEIIWYCCMPFQVNDMRRMSSGNLLLSLERQGAAELDMRGNIVRSWVAANLLADDGMGGYVLPDGYPEDAIPVAADTVHHELIELPPSHPADFAFLSSRLHVVADYPNDEVDTSSTDPMANVISDVIVEMRADGTVVKELDLFDALDPFRLTYDSLAGYWNPYYGSGSRDWTHANAMIYDPSDGNYILSLRHQDAVVKISRETGKPVWILGSHERWVEPWSSFLLDPIEDGLFQVEVEQGGFGGPGSKFDWNYHQHAPQITASGNLLIFDNGNGRAIPPAPELPNDERYSRAAEFEIDEAARTVRGAWRYGGPEDMWYARFIGDADEQPVTGNVLVCDGGKSLDGTGGTRGFGRLVEVTHTQPPQIVWELLLSDESGAPDPYTWRIYRAERLPSLYP